MIGFFIEYSRLADYIIFTINMFILIAKILDTLDLFQNQKVADPSLKYKDNNYVIKEKTIGYKYMYIFI
jgi:hypothetical protein